MRTSGIAECQFALGKNPYNYQFIICKDLRRPCILGLDFLRTFKIGITWTREEKFALQDHNLVLVESIDTYVTGSTVTTKGHIDIPERTLAVLNVTIDWDTKEKAKFYEVKQNDLLKDEYPNLLAIATVFITSPADVETHGIVQLQDAEVTDEHR